MENLTKRLSDDYLDLDLLDEQATDQQVQRLEELLTASEEARESYIKCVQMHSDLKQFAGNIIRDD